jgi:hypothetical protein
MTWCFVLVWLVDIVSLLPVARCCMLFVFVFVVVKVDDVMVMCDVV